MSAFAFDVSDYQSVVSAVKATKVAFSEIREHLPKGLGEVSPGERRERVRERQLHVQNRYRVF